MISKENLIAAIDAYGPINYSNAEMVAKFLNRIIDLKTSAPIKVLDEELCPDCGQMRSDHNVCRCGRLKLP